MSARPCQCGRPCGRIVSGGLTNRRRSWVHPSCRERERIRNRPPRRVTQEPVKDDLPSWQIEDLIQRSLAWQRWARNTEVMR